MVLGPVLELSIIVGIAAVLAIIGRLIRQPPIIAYLITGILVGPLVFNILQTTELIEAFARMGVAFLLFIVGLNLDFRVLRGIGKISVVHGVGEMVAVSSLTFFIALLLGFSYTPALYLAAAFAFSSTVVVVKLLTDKKELDTLHGRIALGILIVEDFVAAIVLMMVPVMGAGEFSMMLIFWQLVKTILLILSVFIFSHLFFPMVFSVAAKNQEILFLFAVSWALIVAMMFDFFGFSLEIGALLAGMALASSQYNLEIKGKVKGLRDFFVVMFFVYFGSQLVGPITGELIFQASVLSAFILIGKPLLVMSFMRASGHKKRTNFLTGISLAQISEFSLIIVLLGFSLGIVSQELFSLTILVALITIALSSYMIYFSQPIFRKLSHLLWIFDGKKPELGMGDKKADYDIFLFGYNRVGFSLLKSFNKAKKKFVVVDYNPKTINYLSRKGIHCIYGDGNDVDFLEVLKLEKAKLVISTIPDLDTNLAILNSTNKKKTIFIPTSHHIKDTRKLYASGANYVIMPHFLGGDFIAHMLTKNKFDKSLLDIEGKRQLAELNERVIEGHSHPHKNHHGK